MRVLVLTHRLPYAPNRGDRLRAYHVLQHLRSKAEVELVSLVHDDEEAGHVDEVRAFVPHVTVLQVSRWRTRINACAALATHRPLTHSLLDAPGMTAVLQNIYDRRRPDVVLAYCSGMARFALQPPLDGVPLVLDFVDVDSGKWRDLADKGTPPLSWIYRHEAATLGAFEARAAARARACLVVNPREAALARALTPAANVKVLANGVEMDRLRPTGPPAANLRVVFCGVMSYAPNDEGVRWFVRNVWPLVRAQHPQASLAIVGSEPSQSVRNFGATDPSITVTGRVPEVRDWLWKSAVGIAPLHVARGVQNKALEAIAAGLPIVITPAVAGGLPPEIASATRVADMPTDFAGQVSALLRLSPGERRAMAESADLNALTWARTLESLMPILERAAHSRESGLQSAGAPIAWPSA